MRPGILPRLSLDFLGVWLFEESRQLRTEFGEMVEQLRISKIVRSRNVRVPIDCGDPGLENLLAMSQHKIAEPSNYRDRKLCLTLTSDGRDPPNL